MHPTLQYFSSYFCEWLNQRENIIIYVDFDHTLIEVLSEGYQAPIREWDCKEFTYGQRKYTAFVRPGARVFIKRLVSLAPTLILTAGYTDFQEAAAEAVNFPLPEIFGRDRYDEVPPCKNGILIDNMDHDFHYTAEKLEIIGIQPDRLVKVDSWHANMRTDNGLLTVLPKVQRLIQNT